MAALAFGVVVVTVAAVTVVGRPAMWSAAAAVVGSCAVGGFLGYNNAALVGCG